MLKAAYKLLCYLSCLPSISAEYGYFDRYTDIKNIYWSCIENMDLSCSLNHLFTACGYVFSE